MSKSSSNQESSEKPILAICYDFDKTLSPDDMQTFTLIPSLGMDKESFWKESNELAEKNKMDYNLAWMRLLFVKSIANRVSIRKEYFTTAGKDVPLYKGVVTWFERVNRYGEQQGVEIQHYIISSGLKEIIEGSPIAQYIKRIYASAFLYSTDGVAEWPAQAINYTTKTQFIFRIAKGFFEECDDRVNDTMSPTELYIPYQNIVYIGDSATDIPCMRLVKSKGGISIGVFDPLKNQRKKVYQLFNDDRIDLYAPADYSAKKPLYKYMRFIIDRVSANSKIESVKSELSIPVAFFTAYKSLSDLGKMMGTRSKAKQKQFEESLSTLKSKIEGNID